jgi:hypothetical protein
MKKKKGEEIKKEKIKELTPLESPPRIIEIDKNAKLMQEVKGLIKESRFHFIDHNIDKVN